ncbi:MAG: hypothetical protein ACRBC3_16530 [Burkholderiaceae bacterium]
MGYKKIRLNLTHYGILIAMVSVLAHPLPAMAFARSTAPGKPAIAPPLPTVSADKSDSNAQIIWPPLDQPIDFRGAYRDRLATARSVPSRAAAKPGELSDTDCAAAGAFILAGARARDRGVSAKSFMTRLRADLLKLGAEPPDTRWFLHTEAEASLLHSAARDIFSRPTAPATHYREFLAQCEAGRRSAVSDSRR